MSKSEVVMFRCEVCGTRCRMPRSEFPQHCCDRTYNYPEGVTDENPPPAPPGEQLRAIFRLLDVRAKNGCTCETTIRWMNRIGVDGCRLKKSKILKRLRHGYDDSSLAVKAKALGLAIWNGLPLSLEGLLDEAIRRAEGLALSAKTAATQKIT